MKIPIFASFDPPAEEEIESILKDHREEHGDDQTDVTRESIQREIDRAKKWLEKTVIAIDEYLEVNSLGGDDTVKATLAYREGEDLGYGCNNPGPNPFNNVYFEAGPTVHLCLTGNVKIGVTGAFGAVGNKNILFEDFYPDCGGSGSMLMLRVEPLKMYVAVRYDLN